MIDAIICRLNPITNKPVIFIVDEFDKDKSTIGLWSEDNKITTVPVSFYNVCGPLSASDENELKKQFLYIVAQSDVHLRSRLPRSGKVRPNLIVPTNVVETKQEPAQDIFTPETIAQINQAKEAPQKAQEASKQAPQAARAEDVRVERHKPVKRGRKPSVDIVAKLEQVLGELAYLKRAYTEAGFELPKARGSEAQPMHH